MSENSELSAPLFRWSPLHLSLQCPQLPSRHDACHRGDGDRSPAAEGSSCLSSLRGPGEMCGQGESATWLTVTVPYRLKKKCCSLDGFLSLWSVIVFVMRQHST